MLLDFENFVNASACANSIITSTFEGTLDQFLDESIASVPEGMRRSFYKQINSLLLNVYLNRQEELGPEVVQSSLDARQNILQRIRQL